MDFTALQTLQSSHLRLLYRHLRFGQLRKFTQSVQAHSGAFSTRRLYHSQLHIPIVFQDHPRLLNVNTCSFDIILVQLCIYDQRIRALMLHYHLRFWLCFRLVREALMPPLTHITISPESPWNICDRVDIMNRRRTL